MFALPPSAMMQCPLWVISGHVGLHGKGSALPEKRTCSASASMSAKCLIQCECVSWQMNAGVQGSTKVRPRNMPHLSGISGKLIEEQLGFTAYLGLASSLGSSMLCYIMHNLWL